MRLRWSLYRLVMRIAHRYHWHYAPPQPQIEPNVGTRLWCHWCGLRGTVWTIEQLEALPGAIKRTSGDAAINAAKEGK